MRLSSPDITQGEPIAARFTCDGEDLSPQLDWAEVPGGAQELALICEDPDAPGGTFFHWGVHGLASGSSGLERGRVPAGAVEGLNDYERMGYGGPCPPRGHGDHRYYFLLFALDSPVDLSEGFTSSGLRQAMEGKILEETSLMGTYRRD
jgi:Raf kinase inhibitor-like YbhB/YbcL family protein